MKIEDFELVKRIFEAALMASEKPLQRKDLTALFDDLETPDDELIDRAITELTDDCELRGYELKRVASGYRYQVKQDLSQWISKLWQERAPRYSRALLETLSLVAYRQPITRGEIEQIRGVAVSSNIIRTLLEREWVKSVGHRDVPGRPAIYATTRQFLDYFNLKSLDQLPPLAEIRDLNTISRELNIELPLDEVTSANDDNIEGEAQNVNADQEGSNPADESTSVNDDLNADLNETDEGSIAEHSANSTETAELSETVESTEESVAYNDEAAAFESWIDDELVDDEAEQEADSRQTESRSTEPQSESLEKESELELQVSGNRPNNGAALEL